MFSGGIANGVNAATGQIFGGRKARQISLLEQNLQYNQLINLFINRFKWSGTGMELHTPYYIERCLFNYGLVGVVNDERFGMIALPAYPAANNIYGEPVAYQLMPLNTPIGDTTYFVKPVPADEIAIIRDTPFGIAPLQRVLNYAAQLADILRTEQVYVKGLKSPNVAVLNASNKATAAAMQQKIDDNEEIIVVSDLSQTELKAFQSGRQAVELQRIAAYRKTRFNELMAELGLKADTLQKSAQMSNDEIENNNMIAAMHLQACVDARQNGIDEIKRKFGLSDYLKFENNVMKQEQRLADERDEEEEEEEPDNERETA